MCTVVDGHGVGGQPAVALDEPHAVGSVSAQPVGADEVRVLSYAIRILRQLVLQQFRRQHLPIRPPHIAPAGVPCVGDVDYKVGCVLRSRIGEHGDIQIDRCAAARLIIAVEGIAAHTAHDHGVDVHGVAALRVCHHAATPCGEFFIDLLHRQGHGHLVCLLHQFLHAVLLRHRYHTRPRFRFVEAVHKAVCGSAGRRVVAEAEGKENSLDLYGVKAAFLGFLIDIDGGRIQKGECLLHLGDMCAVFFGDFVRKLCAVERRGYHGVVVLGRSVTEAAQERRQQDQRRQEQRQHPTDGLSAILICQQGSRYSCQYGRGHHFPPAVPNNTAL